MAVTVTLTPDELAYIRLQMGDTCIKLTDETIQLAYNAAGGDEGGTNALLARWNWMAASTTTINVANGGQSLSTAKITVYKERMKYWENCAGTAGGTLSVGVLSLGIDADEDWLDSLLSESSW